jgi:hypothetical protein
MIQAETCIFVDLDRLVGRLNHSSYVIPIARHFLGRLQSRLTPRPHNPNSRRLRLTDLEIDDITLWKEILDQANLGVSLNLLVTRQPDRIERRPCLAQVAGFLPTIRIWKRPIPHSAFRPQTQTSCQRIPAVLPIHHLESERACYRSPSNPVGRRHYPPSRKPLGCGVSAAFPGQPPAHPGELSPPTFCPCTPEIVRNQRCPKATTASSDTQIVTSDV